MPNEESEPTKLVPTKREKLVILSKNLSHLITEARKTVNEIAEISLGLADDESVQQLRRNLLDAAIAEGMLSAKINPDRGGNSPSPAYGGANYGEGNYGNDTEIVGSSPSPSPQPSSGNYGETEVESAPSPRPADSPADPYGNYGGASPASSPTPYSG